MNTMMYFIMEEIIDFSIFKFIHNFCKLLQFHYYRIWFYKKLSIYKTNSMKYLYVFILTFSIIPSIKKMKTIFYFSDTILTLLLF